MSLARMTDTDLSKIVQAAINAQETGTDPSPETIASIADGDEDIPILIANLAQIIAVGSSAIFAVVLTFAHEKWQLILQAAHIVLFVAIAIPLTKSQGVYGFALSSVIANTLRMLSIVAVGIINGGKLETIHEN